MNIGMERLNTSPRSDWSAFTRFLIFSDLVLQKRSESECDTRRLSPSTLRHPDGSSSTASQVVLFIWVKDRTRAVPRPSLTQYRNGLYKILDAGRLLVCDLEEP